MTNLPSNVYRGGNPADSDLSDSELSSVGFVSTRSPIETTQRPKVQSGPNGACASFFYRHKWFFLALAGLAIYFHIQIFLGLAFRQVFSYVIPFPPGVKVRILFCPPLMSHCFFGESNQRWRTLS